MKSNRVREGTSGVLSYGMYAMYQKKFVGRDKKCDAYVSYHIWSRICNKFNKMKMMSIMDGEIFNMPYRLGSLGIIQFKRRIKFHENGDLDPRGLVPDWHKTWVMWKKLYPECETMDDFRKIKNKKVVYRTNEHTDGRIFKFHWKKKYSNIKNISAYELIVPWQHRQRFSRFIFNNPNKQYCEKF